jgi:hypothetical protein
MIATQLCPLYTYYRGCDTEVQKGEIEFLTHTTRTIVGKRVSLRTATAVVACSAVSTSVIIIVHAKWRLRAISSWIQRYVCDVGPDLPKRSGRQIRSGLAPSQSQLYILGYRIFDRQKVLIFCDIKDSLHSPKFLWEKTKRCEKYTAIKFFTDSIFFGHFAAGQHLSICPGPSL